MNVAQMILRFVIRLYQMAISPVLTAIFGPLGFGCRFEPTCSQYALIAIREHGVVRGTWLAVRRLARCHPWGGSGHDPVPPRTTAAKREFSRSHAPTTTATELACEHALRLKS